MDIYELYRGLSDSLKSNLLNEASENDEFSSTAIDYLVFSQLKDCHEKNLQQKVEDYNNEIKTDLQMLLGMSYGAMYRNFLIDNDQVYNLLSHYDVVTTLNNEGLERLQYVAENYESFEQAGFEGYHIGSLLREKNCDLIFSWLSENWDFAKQIGATMILEIGKSEEPVKKLEQITHLTNIHTYDDSVVASPSYPSNNTFQPSLQYR